MFSSWNGTQVSLVSCTGRRVLCHQHHLGSWRQPETRPEEEISTCLKRSEQREAYTAMLRLGSRPGQGGRRDEACGVRCRLCRRTKTQGCVPAGQRPGSSKGQSKSGDSLCWRHPGGRRRNNPEFSNLCQQRPI